MVSSRLVKSSCNCCRSASTAAVTRSSASFLISSALACRRDTSASASVSCCRSRLMCSAIAAINDRSPTAVVTCTKWNYFTPCSSRALPSTARGFWINLCRAGLRLWGALHPKHFVGPHYTYSICGVYAHLRVAKIVTNSPDPATF